ncbi:ArnT family glycosyltransferase [Devosia sp.]|uniref:ArnT family glycosyltransferase n=1 Tax=Devosia sp. TaxID=1871048 RepID=UPI002EFAAC96
MAVAAAETQVGGERQSRLALQLLVGYFLALKLWFDLGVDPMGDEAYYWMWGQYPAWSYFDHPPLHGWLLGLVAQLFGWHPFNVRLLTWVTLLGTLAIFWDWARRMLPDDPQRYFWQTAAIYLATPVLWLMSTFAFHDHLLLFLVVAAARFFLKFADQWETGGRSVRDLYLGAVCLGLAVLTKYNGVFLGFGFGLMVLVRPRLRTALASPHLWLAALLSVLMQAPVLYWNLAEGFASYRFHLNDRLTGSWDDLKLWYPPDFVANMALVISPFFFIALFRLRRDRSQSDFEHRARALALAVFGVSTATFLAVSLFVYVYFYWNIVGYVSLIAIAFRYIGQRWLFRLHLAFGTVMATLLTVNFTVLPLVPFFGLPDWGTAANYGWGELAQEVEALHEQHPQAFLAATRYTYAAQLGFQLHDKSVTSFNTLRDQYDFWTDRAALRGRDAIIVADGAWPIRFARSQFETMTPLKQVEITRLGRHVTTFEVYLGENYAPTE